jgi:hypothetical protein
MAWWLWPHVLSLDAPIVAVVWQHWWATIAGAKLLWFHDVILALAVWMIYLADRLADTRNAVCHAPETARHAFSARHRRALTPLLACVVLFLTVLTPAALSRREFEAGLGLLLVAGGYFWLIHRPQRSRQVGPASKEAFVGAIFALGTAFFATWRSGPPSALVLGSEVMFALLCFLNCALITQWEGAATEPDSHLSRFRPSGRLGIGCMWLAAAAGLLAIGSGSAALAPIALGALALAWLDRQRAWFSPNALRVLADLALLAPLLCGGWLR